MPVTYTNRKGYTYYLCQGLTKKGNPRYFFSRTLKDTVLEEIPQGYEIRESVNGNVSLAKIRPVELLDSEIRAVQEALNAHPKARLYRKDVKPRQITIYESLGADIGHLSKPLKRLLGSEAQTQDLMQQIQEEEYTRAQFSPVMRFTLTDDEHRFFVAERMCYRGSVEDWIEIEIDKTIDELCARLISKLGTEGFFDLI